MSGDISADAFTSRLLTWFAENGRDLPWRQRPSPYAVWISEIMLQQTQVDRVIPFFRRWMARFPDLESLAGARQDEVLKQWEGLGYYIRAANIHRAAREIQDRHRGRMPQEAYELARLPGIGDYTASAIASIAFGQACPAVDANAVRVGSRLFDVDAPKGSVASRSRVREGLARLVPLDQPGRFNQAVMDLGALVCRSRKPLCHSCPVMAFCQAKARGMEGQRPVPTACRKPTAIDVAAGVLVHEGRILIQKRPPNGLMANLWEFPGGKLHSRETPEQALRREFLEELELSVEVGRQIMIIRHSYTRFRVTLFVHWCRLLTRPDRLRLRAASDYRWVLPGELDGFAFPSADRKLLTVLKSELGKA